MPTAYRIAKASHPVFDGTGAYLTGGRWNSPGRQAIYASTCLAGSLLEALAHAGQLRKLPGRHHCARAHIPDGLEIEVVDELRLAGWGDEDCTVAREYGDGWLGEARTAVLSVPALTARPYGRHLVLNPEHSGYARIRIEDAVPIVWDARLFRV